MLKPPARWRPYRYRIFCVLIAVLFVLLCVYASFGKALFMILLSVIGYLIGAYLDRQA